MCFFVVLNMLQKIKPEAKGRLSAFLNSYKVVVECCVLICCLKVSFLLYYAKPDGGESDKAFILLIQFNVLGTAEK